MAAPALLSVPRLGTLITSALVALGSGTNYVFSAYAPQLGARLHITHTQLNVIAVAGNVGVYGTGPIWGRIVDSHGPRILLACAFIFLLSGYSGMRYFYDAGVPSGDGIVTLSMLRFYILVLCSFITGVGGNGGLASGLNATAKSFPDRARTTTTGFVLSGFGLSAFFFSTMSHALFAGNTSSFLLVLSLGTSLPMILGFFFVRPIPLPASELKHGITDEEITAGQASSAVFHREDDSHTALLEHDDNLDNSEDPNSDHDVRESEEMELSPPRSLSPRMRSPSRRRSRSTRRSFSSAVKLLDGRSNVHGWRLWVSGEFWLLFMILSMLCGTGLMYINNVGSISQALCAKGDPSYDKTAAAVWQAAQVSTVSLMNFIGRILIGLVADFTKNKLHRPRTYCVSLVAFLFIVAQVMLVAVDDIRGLWKSSALLGLAYGSLFGVFPTVCIDWFGLTHFSENWGYLSLAPLLGGNLFSIAFGRNLDAHAPTETPPSLLSRAGLPSSHQCLEGRDCYVSSVFITIAACFLALILSLWAGWRDRQKMAAEERAQGPVEVIWEASDE